MKTFLIVLASVLVLGTVGYFGMSWKYQNKEMRLRHNIEGHIDVSKAHYSKMQNIIFGNVEVAKEYTKQFKEFYTDFMSGRAHDKGGQLMKWVQESHPNFSTELYANIQRQIVAQRESFHNNQKQLRNLGVEHDNLLNEKPFGAWFLSDKEHIEIPIIKNEGVDKMFETQTETPKPLF